MISKKYARSVFSTFIKVTDYDTGKTKLINKSHITIVTESYEAGFIKTVDGTCMKTVETFEEVSKLIL